MSCHHDSDGCLSYIAVICLVILAHNSCAEEERRKEPGPCDYPGCILGEKVTNHEH